MIKGRWLRLLVGTFIPSRVSLTLFSLYVIWVDIGGFLIFLYLCGIRLYVLILKFLLNTKIERMKKLMYILTAMCLFVGVVFAQAGKGAVISSPKIEHDFGVIKEANGKVTHTFTVKNTGTAPLVITRVVATCGCTTPKYDVEPIAPGKEGKVVVTYNPAGRPGQFVKTIAVYSNGFDGAFTLRIKGVVE